MAKRRTKKQKIKAQNKYQFTFKPFESVSARDSETSVKSYFSNDKFEVNDKQRSHNNPTITEQSLNLKLIKKDLIKSVFVSSFILCLIVVIYLTWYK